MSDLLFMLGEKLSAAIQAGDTNEASKLVTQLSNMKLKLDINIKKDEIEQRNKEDEFSVRVHVEDRLSDGCYFYLQVKSCDTIQDLKRKVMLKHNFPEEVQRWIIGKKLPENENKLSQCGVKGPGHTLYLYLVTARSVGLSKQEHEARLQALHQGISLPHKQPSQSGLHSPVQRESPESYWPAPLSPLETESHNCSNNPSPVLLPSPDLGMGEVDQSSYGTTRQTSKKSLTSGSSLIQEMLMASNQPSPSAAADNRQKPVPSEGAANGLEHWENGYENRVVKRPFGYRRFSTTPPPEIEKIGWECPTCTYINLPIRPGCEMCTGPRPAGYRVPSGYQITVEERMLLENDQLLEKMTREAQPTTKHEMVLRAPPRPNYHRATYEQLKENLQLIDSMNSHTTNNNNVNHRNSSGNNQIVGSDLAFITGGADWGNMSEIPLRASPVPEPRHRGPHQHHQRSHSSHRSGSVVAPPPIENNLPRHSPSPSRNPRTTGQSSHLNQVSADNIYNDVLIDDDNIYKDVPLDDDYYS